MKRMKREFELIGLSIYLLIAIIGLFLVLNWISQFVSQNLGESVINIAKLTSASIEITDEEFDELMEINFDELRDNSVNKEMEDIFEHANLSDNIEYAYVVHKLEDEQIRYEIENKGEAEFYDKEMGTKLDYVWLLDYVVSDELRSKANADETYYDDINRYTNVDDKTIELYENEESGYFFNDDEWGKQITGFVPLYTEEGTYIGLLGIDIFANDFYEYRQKIAFAVRIMFVLLLIILVTIYTFHYFDYGNKTNKDKLTNLYTRNYYEKYANGLLKKMNSSTDSLTIMMIDIDEFKLYNDFYGHVKGDVVLAEVSKIISVESAIYPSCAGRFGGEEFVVIIPNITEEQGDELAEHIRSSVQGRQLPHEKGRTDDHVTISVGIFTTNDSKFILEQLIELADVGLYEAKNGGRNKVVRNIYKM